jgi:hypothetical protein
MKTILPSINANVLCAIVLRVIVLTVIVLAVIFSTAVYIWAQQAEAKYSEPWEDPEWVEGFPTPLNPEKELHHVDKVGNSIDPALTQVKIEELFWTADNPNCAQEYAKSSVYYPSGTGSKDLDILLAREAETMLAESQKIFTSSTFTYITPEICQSMVSNESKKVYQARRTFDIYTSRPGLISILFTANLDTGGNHPSNEFYSFSFDIEKNRELEVEDLFPDWSKSGEAFWNYLKIHFCELSPEPKELPRFFSYKNHKTLCLEDPPLPEALNPPKSLKDFGNVIFTKTGLLVFLGAYDSWGYVSGYNYLSIPKKELLAMRASPALWE